MFRIQLVTKLRARVPWAPIFANKDGASSYTFKLSKFQGTSSEHIFVDFFHFSKPHYLPDSGEKLLNRIFYTFNLILTGLSVNMLVQTLNQAFEYRLDTSKYSRELTLSSGYFSIRSI